MKSGFRWALPRAPTFGGPTPSGPETAHVDTKGSDEVLCLTTQFKLLNARPERDALGSGPVVLWSSLTRATVRLGQTCFLLSPGGRSTLGSGAKWS